MEQQTNKNLLRSKELIKIGLTGGIGAGKSIIAKIFGVLGIPVFDADKVGKEILVHDQIARQEIIELLGRDSYSDGQPNRKYIAEKIFGDDALRLALNKIIHPKVADAYDVWIAEHLEAPYTIKEAAISFETGIYKQMDANILVVAPEALRIKRVQSRDQAEVKSIKDRMNAQWSDKVKLSLTDYTITNDEKSAVLPQVLEIHNELIRQSRTDKTGV